MQTLTRPIEEPLREILDWLRWSAERTHPAALNAENAQELVDDIRLADSSPLAELPASAVDDLVVLLRRMHCADQRLYLGQAAQSMEKAMTRLEKAPLSVRGLMDMAPELICELGFDRATISRVEDALWLPDRTFITDDAEWAQSIYEVGQQHPCPLVPQLIEFDLVKHHQPVVVHDVQQNPRVYTVLAEETRTRSYVAAPIVMDNRVVGMLHADHYLRGDNVDDTDRYMLCSAAYGIQLALTRAAMAEQLRSVGNILINAADMRTSADRYHGALPTRLPNSHETPIGLIKQDVCEGNPEVDQFGRGVNHPLTKREFEVLKLVGLGRTNAAIAQQLVITEDTVKQHVKHILRKLRVGNRAAAVSWFYRRSAALEK